MWLRGDDQMTVTKNLLQLSFCSYFKPKCPVEPFGSSVNTTLMLT